MPPQSTRCYFLWFFDEKRANSLLLSDVYKAMSRNIQRTMVEKEKRKHLIEKSERSDVKANYEEYMTKNEKRELEIWRSREERLLAQLMRLDRIVMILRDF
jgi:DNA-directed RNA polymerase III subunit RPC3